MYFGIQPSRPPPPSDVPVFLPAPRDGRVPETTDCIRSTIELLGSKYIDGVLVDGQRSVAVFPAGCQGATREFTAITELWVARVQRVLMFSESTDPHIGDTTVRFQNLSLTDPDLRLFQPPPGYTVVE